MGLEQFQTFYGIDHMLMIGVPKIQFCKVHPFALAGSMMLTAKFKIVNHALAELWL
jgi:hypothetical protein